MRVILAAALLVPFAAPAWAQNLSATATVPAAASLEPLTAIANPGQLSLGGGSTSGPFPTLSAQGGGLVNAGQLSFGGGGSGGGSIAPPTGATSAGTARLSLSGSGSTGGAGVTGTPSRSSGTGSTIGATGTRNGFNTSTRSAIGSISGNALSNFGTGGFGGGSAVGTSLNTDATSASAVASGAGGFGTGAGIGASSTGLAVVDPAATAASTTATGGGAFGGAGIAGAANVAPVQGLDGTDTVARGGGGAVGGAGIAAGTGQTDTACNGPLAVACLGGANAF